MSKASDYAKARAHQRPRADFRNNTGGCSFLPSAYVTETGDCEFSQEHIGGGGKPDKVVLVANEVPALIKWLKETFED